MMTCLSRPWRMCIATMLSVAALNLATAFPAAAQTARLPQADAPAAYDDEPDELSWELLANGYEAHKLWAAWLSQQPAAAREQAVAAAKQAGMIPDAAHEETSGATSIVIHAEKMTGDWSPAVVGGRKVIRGIYGHNSASARMVVNVPAAGRYRLWTRWFNNKGYFSSFTVSVRSREVMDHSFAWQLPEQPDWLRHVVGFTPHKRAGEYPLNFEAERYGFLWDASPVVELPAGQVTLEVRNMVHGAPYTFRVVDCFVLTQDPLFDPTRDAKAVQVPDGEDQGASQQDLDVTRGRQPSAEARLAWALRPASRPVHEAPEALAQLWRAFRHDLIERLAAGQSLSPYEKSLTTLHYFDERWNMVGTPAQVAQRVEQLGTGLRATGYYNWIEAEDFEHKQGWEPIRHGPSSSGGTLRAHYANGKAEATQRVSVPHAGQYRLWVRATQYMDRYSVFEARVQRGSEVVARKVFDELGTFEGQDPQQEYKLKVVHGWTPVEVTLQAGEHQIVLAKNIGKGPYGVRRVDAVVLTDDLRWQPAGGQRPWVERGQRRGGVTVWAGDAEDHWDGFMFTDQPTDAKVESAKKLVVRVQPGAVAQRAIHLTNDTDESVTLTPRVEAGGAVKASWRVVAWHQREIYDWETPVKVSDWQPVALLSRHAVTLPAKQTTTLWVTVDARGSGAGAQEVLLTLRDDLVVKMTAEVGGVDIRHAASPVVGGWTNLPGGARGLPLFEDIGLTLVHGGVVRKEVQRKHGLKHVVLYIGVPRSAEHVKEVVKAVESMGLTYEDWSWEIMDEPTLKAVPVWVEAAKVIRAADPQVRLWCNPGDIAHSTAEAVTAMSPYIDVFCPFVNHFRSTDEAYRKLLATLGRPRLLYTTPSTNEKSPDGPRSQLGLADLAIEHGRDGWSSFSLFAYYPYAATAWDEVYNMLPDQAVCIYPGAWNRLISTRNLEATRAAVAVWKTHHTQAQAR